MILFTYDPDAAEGLRAAKIASSRSGWNRFLRVATPVVVILVAIGLWRMAGGFAAAWRQYGLVVAVLVAAWALLPQLQRWAVLRPYRKQVGAAPQTFTVSDDGVALDGPIVATRCSWDGLLRVLETDEFFLFYRSETITYFLPKRIVSTAQDHELRGLLQRHLGHRCLTRA